MILCDLEGRSYEDAARCLGCPVGTVKSRLARGRDRLKQGLTRRGLAPQIIVPGSLFSSDAHAGLSAALIDTTIRSAIRVGVLSEIAAGAVPSSVVTTRRSGVLATASVPQWKVATTIVLSVGLAARGPGGRHGHVTQRRAKSTAGPDARRLARRPSLQLAAEHLKI